ncbi:MAG TPA: hypothetical protein PK306_09985 [Aquabacterium sp.]|nr:hypothetical protein [Aquabacterium sp.]
MRRPFLTLVLAVGSTASTAQTVKNSKDFCTPEKEDKISLQAPSEDGWQRLIGNVNRGDYVVLTAAGTQWTNGSFNVNKPNSDMLYLDGVKDVPSNIQGGAKSLVDPLAKFGALIGRIGKGTPFRIGVGTSVSAGNTGPLFVQMNDVVKGFPDNRGEVLVRWQFCIK